MSHCLLCVQLHPALGSQEEPRNNQIFSFFRACRELFSTTTTPNPELRTKAALARLRQRKHSGCAGGGQHWQGLCSPPASSLFEGVFRPGLTQMLHLGAQPWGTIRATNAMWQEAAQAPSRQSPLAIHKVSVSSLSAAHTELVFSLPSPGMCFTAAQERPSCGAHPMQTRPARPSTGTSCSDPGRESICQMLNGISGACRCSLPSLCTAHTARPRGSWFANAAWPCCPSERDCRAGSACSVQ